jgi:hypothetical protein
LKAYLCEKHCHALPNQYELLEYAAKKA